MLTLHTLPINISRFRNETLGMTPAQIGSHLLLLMTHFELGERGLPADNAILAKIANVSLKEWENKLGSVLEPLWVTDTIFDDDGRAEVRLINHFCLETIETVRAKSAIARANAKKRIEKKGTKAQQ